MRCTGEPTWKDAFVRSFWPFHDSEDFGSYANTYAFPAVSAARSDSVLPSTRNSVERTSMLSKSFASWIKFFSPVLGSSFHRKKYAPFWTSPMHTKFLTTLIVTVCTGVSKNATGMSSAPSHACTMSFVPMATTRWPSSPDSALHAIFASRTHATRPTHLVSPSTICQLISNKMTRPRHGVSSPPGIAVPTASIECNAPVRRFLTCTFFTAWTCSPGSIVRDHAVSNDPGTRSFTANCSSTPPRAIAFARRVFTTVAA
mmetsp:Transcript_10611/g.38452  ORF Transcript_10611/g.38452 Transcript_10611/m.38452 type:complete len:258 (-) Transcript_10611:585-1358(-)